MTETTMNMCETAPCGRGQGKAVLGKTLLLGALALLCFAAPAATQEATRGALADAYIQVSSFVAMTLMLFYMLERGLKLDVAMLLDRYRRWQVPVAAIVGALPGCGGAIIVITQYVMGRLSFGGMVAVLCSTMGDAAFLLLAREPKTALLVMGISIVAGTLAGWLVDKAHGQDFMRGDRAVKEKAVVAPHKLPICNKALLYSWYSLMVPGLLLGIGAAFQQDIDQWFGPLAKYEPSMWIGVFGAFLCLWAWARLSHNGFSMFNLTTAAPEATTGRHMMQRVVFETSFVTTWVIVAFLAYELGMLWSGFDLGSLFGAAAPFLPLIGTFIGFVPGCGPQIVVTTLYLSGHIPLSAQLANAISNDGDALFPAIAMVPKAAILATIYTAVPALMVSYGWYFWA